MFDYVLPRNHLDLETIEGLAMALNKFEAFACRTFVVPCAFLVPLHPLRDLGRFAVAFASFRLVRETIHVNTASWKAVNQQRVKLLRGFCFFVLSLSSLSWVQGLHRLQCSRLVRLPREKQQRGAKPMGLCTTSKWPIYLRQRSNVKRRLVGSGKGR